MAQLLGAANPQAKALFEKILTDPIGLTAAKSYMKVIDKPGPTLSHKDFYKIHDNHNLSNNQILGIAETLREDRRRNFIESNLETALRNHSNMTVDMFDITQFEMKIAKKGWNFLCVRRTLGYFIRSTEVSII